MAKTLQLNESRIGIIYELDDNLINDFILSLKNLNDEMKKDLFSSTINKNILDNSEVYEYSLGKNLTENVILDKIYTLKLFKKTDNINYHKCQLLFIFKCSPVELKSSSIGYSLNSILNIFLKGLTSNSQKTWSQLLSTKIIAGTYTYEKDTIEDTEKKCSILTIPDGSIFDDENFYANKNSQYYFAKNNFYEVALHNMDKSYKYRILGFALSIAYKNYFQEHISKMAKEALVLGQDMDERQIIEKFNYLIKYANEINIFETAYYYEIPINQDSYQAYKVYPLLEKGLKLTQTYKEFKSNLDSILNIISILESRIREDERNHQKEIEVKNEEKEKRFTSLVGIITGIIAILTFFADGPSILKNAFNFEATPMITWGVFSILGVTAFGLYKSFTAKIKMEK